MLSDEEEALSEAPREQVAESRRFQVLCDHPIQADDRQAVFAL